MDLFLYIVFSYPVVIYSILFIVVLLYWLVCAIGLFDFGSSEVDADIDIAAPEADVDMDLDLDADVDADIDADAGGAESDSTMGLISGLLFKFGLHGIPMTIIISLLVISGWFVSSVAMQFLHPYLGAGSMRFLAGTGVFAASLIAAAWLTGRTISPIRRFLDKRKEDTSAKSLCGRPATVRSGAVTERGGQIQLVKDGSTFILNAQILPGEPQPAKGDTVYILEYHEGINTYTVVSKEKFRGM